MLQEPAEELLQGESHGPGLTAMGIVLPAKGDVVALHRKKPMIRNRHPMGVPGQVLKDVLWPAKGRLGINDSLLPKQSAQVRPRTPSGWPRTATRHGKPAGCCERPAVRTSLTPSLISSAPMKMRTTKSMMTTTT